MRLSNARLCLDCDEVHDEARCPVCASESFAFIKRWVTVSERRGRPGAASSAPQSKERAETVETYRALLSGNGESRMTAAQLLRGGALGLAVLGAAGWLLQRNLKERNAGSKPGGTSGSGGPEGPPTA